MRRPGLHLCASLAAGLLALAMTAAIAFGSPWHHTAHGRSSPRTVRCPTRAAARRAARRHLRCRRVHRKAPQTGSADHTVPALGTAATGPTTSTPAGGEPGSSSSATEAQGGEVSTAPPSIPHIQVTAVEYHFTLSQTTVPAGKVVIEFVNDGQDEHNLNLLSGEGTLAGKYENTVPKGVSDQELELRPGSYTLFCSLPEHEQKGMKATLRVE